MLITFLLLALYGFESLYLRTSVQCPAEATRDSVTTLR